VPAATVDDLTGVLPLALTALLGRDADMQMLRQWLADPAARLVTLVGPGGVGKTRLALELARAVAGEGATRVTFVPLAAIRNPSFVAAAVGESLGLSDVAASDLPVRARVTCEDRPTLVVLDNFEHVLDATALVADLLSSVASLRLLVTSRAPLRVRGEREYAVGPLALDPGSENLPPADLARSPAVRLFVERVRDVQPDFRLTTANCPSVSAICRRLDALPLALELAAPWMKVLTAEDLLRRLSDDVLLSSVGPRDLPERQQTINATVAWSYQLLEPDEQRAFRRLGSLPGRFPIEAAGAVLAGRDVLDGSGDDALGVAARLIDKSLLHRVEASVTTRPLYQMLETVRAFAANELTSTGERDDAMEGLSCYCAREASAASKGLVGPAQVEWLDRVRNDLESYRGALTWLIEHQHAAEASSVAWGLVFYWLIRGHAAEGLRWYEQILDLPSLPAGAEMRSLTGAALMWYVQGNLQRACDGLDRAIAIGGDADDRAVVMQAENLRGHIERAFGHMEAARDRFARSAEGFQELAIPWGRGSALCGLAGVALATGDVANAERLLEEATSVLRQAGPWFLMPVSYLRAIRAVRRGDPDEAIALVRENLDHIRALHDKFAFVYALVPLAAAAAQKGDDAWAARILGARDAVIERTGITVADAPVRDLREHAERESKTRLGPDRWARAYATGRRASIDSASDLYRFVSDRHR
jgi:predicted ATPase